MPTSPGRALARHDDSRPDLIERRLRRYAPPLQAAVRAVANRHPRIADLAVSFPALLFALAVPRHDVDPAPALAAAIDGRSLTDVATAADVPSWLRKLPVEALTRPIPRLPDGALLRRQITNHIPRSPKTTAAWLQGVAFAAAWGHDSLAIWFAREFARDRRAATCEGLRTITLWAWYSGQPEGLGHALIQKPWHPAMRYKTALDASDAWRTRVALHVNLGAAPIADMWLSAGHAGGFDFLPLATATDIAEEAVAMQNCLAGYGDNVAHHWSRLWSVRKDGERVATLQISRRVRQPLLSVMQLRGRQNADVPIDVWWAAARWLHQHDLSTIKPVERTWGTMPLDDRAWRSLWRPYWRAKGRIPMWLPLRPSRSALGAL
jgi:hypothetical protein